MSTQAAVKAQINQIEGNMMGLMRRLEKLAAHPDHPTGPNSYHFVQLNTALHPPAEYDGLLGSFILDQGLVCAFGDMGGNASGFDFQNIADCASEFLVERSEATDQKKDMGRGQGTFGLGEHKTICNSFNDVARKQALAAFYFDLDERVDLESALASLDRDLSLARREVRFYAISPTLQ